MDAEIAKRIDDLTAIVLTLGGLDILLALGWMLDDPAVRKWLAAWWSGQKSAPEFCKLHARPVHECRDQHKDD